MDAGEQWKGLHDAVAAARSNHALVGDLPPQPPTLRGGIKARVARVMQRLLFWHTPHLIRFHHALVIALEEQTRALRRLGDEIESLTARSDALAARCSTLENDVVIERGRSLEILRELVGARESRPAPAETETRNWDDLYLSLEDSFRGEREDIKQRLRVYLPRVTATGAGSHGEALLDIGCGRGEWLEVLREAGLRGIGIDSNRAMVAACRKLGLEAHEVGAIEFLRSQPDASLGIVTAFHLLEHLPVSVLLDVLDEALRVLKPGGMAIFETPNPDNLLTASRNFYLDPTHRNPMPSLLGRFLVESSGFKDVEIIELHPVPERHWLSTEQFGEVAERWNAAFYGPQDYAIIGFRR
jgi:SAM-dependent methyltransferase